MGKAKPNLDALVRELLQHVGDLGCDLLIDLREVNGGHDIWYEDGSRVHYVVHLGEQLLALEGRGRDLCVPAVTEGGRRSRMSKGEVSRGLRLRAGLRLAQLVIYLFDRVASAAVGKPSPRHAVLGFQAVGGQAEVTALPRDMQARVNSAARRRRRSGLQVISTKA